MWMEKECTRATCACHALAFLGQAHRPYFVAVEQSDLEPLLARACRGYWMHLRALPHFRFFPLHCQTLANPTKTPHAFAAASCLFAGSETMTRERLALGARSIGIMGKYAWAKQALTLEYHSISFAQATRFERERL